MLVYINFQYGTERVQKAIRLEDIECVSEVCPSTNSFKVTVKGTEIESIGHKTKEEAEMAQMSTISQLNALELMYERAKHVPEDRNSPVFFQVVDPAQKKLVPGKVTLYEQPVYTITI